MIINEIPRFTILGNQKPNICTCVYLLELFFYGWSLCWSNFLQLYSVQIVHMETGLIHAPRFSLIHHCATLRKGSAVLRARASILDPRVSLAMNDELTFWFINFSDTKLLLSFYIESKRKFTCLKLNMARKRHCQIKFYAHFPKQW